MSERATLMPDASASLGRFISEDPIGFGGGTNLYAYIGNSPVNWTDPLELWSTAAHDQIIWNALHPCGVSNADIWQIQQESHFVDEYSQGPEWSYAHAMSSGDANESAADTQNATAASVGNTMHDASEVLGAGGEKMSATARMVLMMNRAS